MVLYGTTVLYYVHTHTADGQTATAMALTVFIRRTVCSMDT